MSGMGELMVYPGMLVLSDECTVIKSAWIREVDVVPVIEALETRLQASEDFATTLTGTHPDDIHKSRDERIEELEAKYHELLYAVERKHPGQTRHETALSYIQAVENIGKSSEAKAADKEKAPETEADS
jgi:hypothetical protein